MPRNLGGASSIASSDKEVHKKMTDFTSQNSYKFTTACYDQSGKQLFASDISPKSIKVNLSETAGLTLSIRGKSFNGSVFVVNEISLVPIIERLLETIWNFKVADSRSQQYLEQSEYKRYRSNVTRTEEIDENDDIFEEFVTKVPKDRSSVQTAQILSDSEQLENDIRNLTDALQTITTMHSVVQDKLNEFLEVEKLHKKKRSKIINQTIPSPEERYAKFFRTVLSSRMEGAKQDDLIEEMIEVMKRFSNNRD